MQQALGIARILAGLPLLFIGALHLFGQAPLGPILEGARMPMPELTAQVAPVLEVLAGLLLVLGFRGRVGALLGIGSMVAALITHARFEATESFAWPDEPPLALPIATLILCLLVLGKGPGAWALGRRRKGGG